MSTLTPLAEGSHADAQRTTLAFTALVLIQLVSIWSFDIFATQDGPVHLLNARVLFDYNAPEHSLFREFYSISHEWNPNWLAQLLLAALLGPVNPDTAEKLLVSVFVVGLPLSMRSLLRSLGASTGQLALLVIPFVQTFSLEMGFYNFCLSLVGYTWLLGQFVLLRRSVGGLRALAFSAGCVVLYFAHVVSTLALLVTVGSTILVDAVSAVRRGAPDLGRQLAQIALLPALWLTPCALLVLYFVGAEGGPAPPVIGAATLDHAIRAGLLQFYTSWGPADLIPLAGGCALIAVFVASSAFNEGEGEGDPSQRALRRGFALAAAIFVAAALVMPPHSLAGEFISDRLLLYPIYLAIGWLALHEAALLKVAWVTPALAILALASAATAWQGQQRVNRELAAFHACDAEIAAGSFLVPLTFEARGRWLGVGSPWERIDPMVHAGSRTAIRRDSVSADNFTAENGNHPLIWQPGYLPRTQIGCTFCMPPIQLDLFAYPRAVDAVLLWKAPDVVPGPLGAQLRAHFTQSCVSPGGETRLLIPTENSALPISKRPPRAAHDSRN